MNLASHPGSAPGYAGGEVAWAHAYGATSDASSRRVVRDILERARRSHEIASDSIFDDPAKAEFDASFAEPLRLIADAIAILDQADAASGISSKSARNAWSTARMDQLRLSVPGRPYDVQVRDLVAEVGDEVDARTSIGSVLGVPVVIRTSLATPATYLVSELAEGDADRLRANPALYRRALRNAPRPTHAHRERFLLVIAANPYGARGKAIRADKAWTLTQDDVPDDFL